MQPQQTTTEFLLNFIRLPKTVAKVVSHLNTNALVLFPAIKCVLNIGIIVRWDRKEQRNMQEK